VCQLGGGGVRQADNTWGVIGKESKSKEKERKESRNMKTEIT